MGRKKETKKRIKKKRSKKKRSKQNKFFKKRDKQRNRRFRKNLRLFEQLSQLTTHHCCPRSRGGSNHRDNKIKIPFLRHAAWHLLYANATLKEIDQLHREKSRAEITRHDLHLELAWQVIYGYQETTARERIAIHHKYWTPEISKKN